MLCSPEEDVAAHGAFDTRFEPSLPIQPGLVVAEIVEATGQPGPLFGPEGRRELS
jgi:hypothetical protein